MSVKCTAILTEKFEYVIVALILLNCVSLSLYRPFETEAAGSWNAVLSKVEVAFNSLFTLEIAVRVGAVGSLREHLRNTWNVFDMLVVLSGYLGMLQVR